MSICVLAVGVGWIWCAAKGLFVVGLGVEVMGVVLCPPVYCWAGIEFSFMYFHDEKATNVIEANMYKIRKILADMEYVRSCPLRS